MALIAFGIIIMRPVHEVSTPAGAKVALLASDLRTAVPVAPTRTPYSSPLPARQASVATPLVSVIRDQRREISITGDWVTALIDHAGRAEAGDVEAALTLADSTNVFGPAFQNHPANVPSSRLHWLRKAADAGSLEGMIRYAHEISALSRNATDAQIAKWGAEWWRDAQATAVRYLRQTLQEGVPDAFPIAHAVLRDGRLGVSADSAAAHATLLIFAREFDDGLPRQLVEQHAARMKPAEIYEAERRASMGTQFLLPQ